MMTDTSVLPFRPAVSESPFSTSGTRPISLSLAFLGNDYLTAAGLNKESAYALPLHELRLSPERRDP